MKIQGKEISEIKINGKVVSEGKLNGKIVYKKSQPTPEYDYLCFEAAEANSIIYINFLPGADIQYSTDKINWKKSERMEPVNLSNVGDKVYLKGVNSSAITNQNYHFFMEGKIKASGTMMSLIDGTGETLDIPSNYAIFSYFFDGCYSLIEPPKLTAINLYNTCYYFMFRNTSIVKAPELPAQILYPGCYRSIFEGAVYIKEIKLHYAGLFNYDYFQDWLKNATSQFQPGTLYYNGSDTTRGQSAIPEGWIVEPF